MISSGVLVNAWAKLDDTTTIDYEVFGDTVEFCFGGRRGNFQLQTSHDGLQDLITKSSEALRRFQAGDMDA